MTKSQMEGPSPIGIGIPMAAIAKGAAENYRLCSRKRLHGCNGNLNLRQFLSVKHLNMRSMGK
ncbi:predicted protein [Sclerotinia sclerotiorum 1980 UF-70]|uniref:Uncharacterized protein n=1 Tax=Sclerotinia sclerotiorum (strain ATCC 18683 / 1980 / Ss-1) TaxID=665079 RepID=A7EM20_SCLS1|nr:predicted protein [Sclerotinia sclerotiorum 1980 UF-70]EDO03886.1 predicted protein [Sclerotinia sclerotiorum 1980 UF-70]